MGASKPNNYSEKELHLSTIARALAHPARISMIQILREVKTFRNTDFAKKLRLSPTAIGNHIDKLKDAELVDIYYGPHHYLISLRTKNLRRLSLFLEEE
jgi:ArsR family transcriptional regulator, arsenate/arsenite/antimonite-responsive transcriptional repressor